MGAPAAEILSVLQAHVPRALWSRPEVKCWDSVADLVTVERADDRSRVLCAYEVKSARDSLARLEQQLAGYSPCMDRITIVCAEKHLRAVVELLGRPPYLDLYPHVGVRVAHPSAHGLFLSEHRPATQNPRVSIGGVWRLLWNDERMALLKKLGHADKVRRSDGAMFARAQERGVTLDEVRFHVTECWQERDWEAFVRKHREQRENYKRYVESTKRAQEAQQKAIAEWAARRAVTT